MTRRGKLNKMKELKTLKDFGGWVDKTHIVANPNPKYHNEVVKKEELKAEAIKWVKFGGCEHQIKWIKHFFNLTKEDLK